MEPNRVEFQKQCIFQSFCKRVLHNEACNAHEEIRRRRAKEVSFSDLALHEERQLYTLDKYFQDEEAEPSYQQAGKKITPKLLLEAIRTLPEEKRKAIMLYYFEGMTDVEIGKLFNTSRSTIQYRRTSSFEILIIVDQRLMSSVITYCAFSFAAMLLYTIVGAADVAFTEAVIGTVSTVYFVIVIKSIRKKRGTDEEDQ